MNIPDFAIVFLWLWVPAVLLTSCENDINTIRKISAKLEVAVETGKDVEILYSSNGEVVYKITGPTLVRHITTNPYT